jgi:hypothetical protein
VDLLPKDASLHRLTSWIHTEVKAVCGFRSPKEDAPPGATAWGVEDRGYGYDDRGDRDRDSYKDRGGWEEAKRRREEREREREEGVLKRSDVHLVR